MNKQRTTLLQSAEFHPLLGAGEAVNREAAVRDFLPHCMETQTLAREVAKG